jgi:hypothetical protein
MTEPTNLEPAKPLHVLLGFLTAVGGNPFVRVEADAAKIFERMKQEVPNLTPDDLVLASGVANLIGTKLRKVHWRLKGKPRPP